ncbi:MAG: helix-turn-helix domain-containing protein [Gaiellaceae bacterium MAG52_C11]|nr:helix-turn-helix domain-containing protein [Candidatus Gaiellasilicea maunaloa]
MRDYAAVVTTGIYCRTGCGANPRPANVTRFGFAAAAEAAGYRACLRCRPYRAPQPLTWSGPELACRAVRLVLGGALDRRTEDELAGRLGVSARHLRRLFAAHVGVTPDGLARSARTHFARRLLDDTDLSVLEIAYAAGFGSVRQLNRACQEVFHAPPRALRARRRKTDRLAADGGLTLRLPFAGPLDWGAMISYFAARAIPGVEHVSELTYRRTFTLGGHPGVLELLPGDHEQLLLRAHLPHWDELTHVVERSRRIAGLDLDLDEPTSHLSGDPAIGPLLEQRPGLRVPGTWDPFETGVRAIIGQHVGAAAANTLTARLVRRLGTPVPGLTQLGLTHLFPTATALAGTDLTRLGLTRTRAGAISAFAQSVDDDTIRLDGSIGLAQLIDSLTALEGIGPWTANYLALRMGERDAFPAADAGLRRAIERHRSRPTETPTRMTERWRPWRALAATHLWLADSAPASRAA